MAKSINIITTIKAANDKFYILQPGQYDVEALEARFGNLDDITIVDLKGAPSVIASYGIENFAEIEEAIGDKEAEEIFRMLDDRSGIAAGEWYDFDDDFFDTFFPGNPGEAARATYFGKVVWNDSYIRFNAYKNLETTDAIDFDCEFDKIVEQWLKENM